MAREFNELRAEMSQTAQIKSEAMAREILAQLPLQDYKNCAGRVNTRNRR